MVIPACRYLLPQEGPAWPGARRHPEIPGSHTPSPTSRSSWGPERQAGLAVG